MNIEIKKSIKPIKYISAIKKMEERLEEVSKSKEKEMIWILEHDKVFTGGSSYKESEILDKSINIVKTNRGGKITYHGPGQVIFYIVLDLKKRKKNIKDLLNIIENTIVETLKKYKIKSFPDRNNIGIWYKNKKDLEKVAAIGIKVKKWIAYHGFALNISNDLNEYNKIIPCGIANRKVTNLKKIKKQNYNTIGNILVKRFLSNLER